MKKMRKILIILGVIFIGFVMVRCATEDNEESTLNEYLIEEIGVSGQIAPTPQSTSGTQQETQQETQVENNLNENELANVINSFIKQYFDWTYVSEGRTLNDYVTERFFTYVQEELGAEYEDLHEHSGEGSEVFFNQTANIFIEDLEIFESINSRPNRFNVIVEFNVFYDVLPIEPFYRHNVLRLEIVNDGSGYLINRMTNIKDIW